jgi:hypothetical protein
MELARFRGRRSTACRQSTVVPSERKASCLASAQIALPGPSSEEAPCTAGGAAPSFQDRAQGLESGSLERGGRCLPGGVVAPAQAGSEHSVVTRDQLRARVRKVVYRTLGRAEPGEAGARSEPGGEPRDTRPRSPLLTERDVRDLPVDSELEVAAHRQRHHRRPDPGPAPDPHRDARGLQHLRRLGSQPPLAAAGPPPAQPSRHQREKRSARGLSPTGTRPGRQPHLPSVPVLRDDSLGQGRPL